MVPDWSGRTASSQLVRLFFQLLLPHRLGGGGREKRNAFLSARDQLEKLIFSLCFGLPTGPSHHPLLLVCFQRWLRCLGCRGKVSKSSGALVVVRFSFHFDAKLSPLTFVPSLNSGHFLVCCWLLSGTARLGTSQVRPFLPLTSRKTRRNGKLISFPLVFSYSEVYGRRLLLIIAFSLYVCFQVGSALAPNTAAVLIFRLLGGSESLSFSSSMRPDSADPPAFFVLQSVLLALW